MDLGTAYGKWLDVPLCRFQLIVALDYSRWFSRQRLVRFSRQRLVRRTVARVIDRRLVCSGNRESLRGRLSRDSIIVWHFQSFKPKQQRIRRWCKDPATPPVVRLTSSRQTEAWLVELRRLSTP
jgi:hypothetical protein